MRTKKLMLHFNFIKKTLQGNPIGIVRLAKYMKDEFGVNYHYVYHEVKDLISLGKIEERKYNNRTQLYWIDKEIAFEHELSENTIKIDKQYKQFITIPSKVRQMKLPLYVIAELGKQIVDLGEDIELMLEINAVKSNKVWYKITQR